MILLKIEEILKKKREEKGYSIEAVVQELKKYNIDVNKSTLSRIEKGERQKIDFGLMIALAQIYDFNFFEYAGYTPKNKIITKDFATIPVYNSVSAGLGCEVHAEPIDFLTIPKFHGEIIGIKVIGDSMEDTILDGSIVIVRKNVNVEIGEIGVFLLNGCDYSEGFVKRLKFKKGQYVLESDNSEYKDIIIKEKDIVSCGKVIDILNGTDKRKKDPLYTQINKLSPEKRKMVEKMLNVLLEEE